MDLGLVCIGFRSDYTNEMSILLAAPAGRSLPMSTEQFKLRLPQRSFVEMLEEGAKAAREGADQPHPPREPERSHLSFVEQLRAGAEAARNSALEDPWEAP